MTLRGEAAIVGLAEVPSVRRMPPDSTTLGLLAKVSTMAIQDAGLTKDSIDGIITYGAETMPMLLAEYMGIQPVHCQGMTQMGSSGSQSVVMAAAAIKAGLANYVLCTLGAVSVSERDARRAPGPANMGTEFEAMYGTAAGAGGGYGLMKSRHMYEYGTTQEQFAKMAVNQRFNALTNPNAAFKGKPITIEDVLSSRMINDPLRMLECVMPCDGAAAVIVTSAARAKALPHRPVYVLGAGAGATTHNALWQNPRIVDTPVKISAPRAFQMAGYAPKDMQFAQFYD